MAPRSILLPTATLLAVLGGGVLATSSAQAAVAVSVDRGVLTVQGDAGSDSLALRLNEAGGRVQVDVGDDGSAEFAFRRATLDSIDVLAGDGDDQVRIDDARGAFTTAIPTRIAGEGGDDTLLGAAGREALEGGAGNDLADGGGGNDVASLGDGEDAFRWDPGEGSDRVEGGAGDFDELDFNGSGANEAFQAKAHGDRARLLRNVGNIRMDLGTLERLEVDALGGQDKFTVGDLTGTPVNDIDTDLGGDGATDRVEVHGTPGSDFADVIGAPGDVFALGMSAMVRVRNGEPSDVLALRGRGGDDRMTAASLAASAARLEMHGDAGDDDLSGGHGNDLLTGANGTDFIDGNGGADKANLGAQLDIFAWDPGDGSDSVEGSTGHDVMLFRGSGDDEQFGVSALGRRLRVTRDLGNIVMDADDVEKVEVGLRAGADRLDVSDLGATDVTQVVAELSSGISGQSLDGKADRIRVEGTGGDDAITVANTIGGVRVSGLAATVDVLRVEAALDTLTLATLGGDDAVDQTGLAPGTIGLAVE